jgi:hypothetical protein
VTGACESTNVFSRESIDRARARLESDLSDSEEKLIKLIAELSLVATRTVRLIREYRRVKVKASEKVACCYEPNQILVCTHLKRIARQENASPASPATRAMHAKETGRQRRQRHERRMPRKQVASVASDTSDALVL